MNITLKEQDIIQAVKMFVESQGINLHNKSLAVDFAMGRGKNGLSAALIITDLAVPTFSDERAGGTLAAATTITNQVLRAVAQPDVAIVDGVAEVAKTAPATLAEIATATTSVATPTTEAAVAAPVAEAKPAEAPLAVTLSVAETAKPATTSLFGG